MTWTKKKSVTLIGIVLAVAMVVAGKRMFFPSAGDRDFAMDERALLQAPGGLVVIRPTHYPYLRRDAVLYASASTNYDHPRVMGRNVPFRDVIAAAYDQRRARVILPPDAPTDHFDFIVTAPSGPEKPLQAEIRKKLGYVAQSETRDTDVLALKIADASLPGLKPSGDQEKRNIFYDDISLHLTHMQIAVMSRLLEQFLETPIVDQTGVTNFYNFSVPWGSATLRRLRDDTAVRATADQMLNDHGLRLEPATVSAEVLVVKKAH